MRKMIAVLCMLSLVMFSANVMADQTNAGIGAGANADANAGATAGSAVNGDVGSNNISNDHRGFAIPGNVQYGPVINYFTKPLPSAGFQPVEEILMYGCFFTEGALEELASGGGTDASLKVVNAAPMAKLDADGKTRWIKIVIQKAPMSGLKFKGFVTATSDSMDATMVQVMGRAALEALKKGANVIHFTAQGAVRDAFSSGWGIGFGSTFAKMYNNSEGQDISGVGYAGMGYSKAKAGMRDMPWLQGFALVDDTLVYPKMETAAPAPKKAEAPVVAPAVKKAEAPAPAAAKAEPAQTGNHIPKK